VAGNPYLKQQQQQQQQAVGGVGRRRG